MRKTITLITGLFVAAFWGNAMAVPVMDLTCGSAERTATMDWAEECQTGLGNPADSPELQSHWPGDTWMDAGEIAGGTEDGFLSIEFLTGGWDEGAFELAWTIADEFWEMYAEAVITIHVGNGNGDPDYFAFLITPGDTEGLLEYMRCDDCRGGGFSNIRLWGRGEGTSVPEPGTALLLGSGLLLLAASKRRRRRL